MRLWAGTSVGRSKLNVTTDFYRFQNERISIRLANTPDALFTGKIVSLR